MHFYVAIKEAKKLSKETIVVVNSCGDAHKDKNILKVNLEVNMINLISQTFKNLKLRKKPALLTYTVAGDDTKKRSLDILKSISKYADICELGFPHNTPIADGGQIQTSSYRAIKNGIKISDVFRIVKKFKTMKTSKPLILMGYYNMIYQYGENKFLKDCKKYGVNGIIVVDLPWPENISFSKKCKKQNICFVQLISPTTTINRAKKLLKVLMI